MDDQLRGGLTRRDLIQRVTMLIGGTALADTEALAAFMDQDVRSTATAAGTGAFTPADIAFLDEVADTILPETSTPGAKAAQTGAFMALMVTTVYGERDQQVFREGLGQVDAACRQLHGTSFMAATPAQRLALLETLDREQHAHTAGRAPGSPPHYFRQMKDLTLQGYFTSEIGYTQAMRYIESPGRFDPCVPHAPGERAWAPHA